MHMDPAMPRVVGAIAAILLIGIVLRRLKQPHVVAYLVAGAILGPFGLGFVEDTHDVARLGEIGVILLLFFAGMEMSLPELIKEWRVPVIGTILQVTLSVGFAFLVGRSLFQSWRRSSSTQRVKL